MEEVTKQDDQLLGFDPARLDVRVLTARAVPLNPGQWEHTIIAATHWRLYQHDKSGGILYGESGDSLALEPRRVYLIPPMRTIRTSCVDSFRQLFIHFDLVGFPGVLAMQDFFPAPVEVPYSTYFSANVTEFADKLAADVPTAEGLDPVRECWARGILYESFARYLSAIPEERRIRHRERLEALLPVIPALRCIHHDIGDRHANRQLAALCNLSEDHFIRRFRAATGFSPVQYVRRSQVAHAAELLVTTDWSIDRIAEKTGFCDRFYFTRVFSNETGRPPAAFRRDTLN